MHLLSDASVREPFGNGLTICAEHSPEDSRTGDGDGLSDLGSLPTGYVVPRSFASGFC